MNRPLTRVELLVLQVLNHYPALTGREIRSFDMRRQTRDGEFLNYMFSNGLIGLIASKESLGVFERLYCMSKLGRKALERGEVTVDSFDRVCGVPEWPTHVELQKRLEKVGAM